MPEPPAAHPACRLTRPSDGYLETAKLRQQYRLVVPAALRKIGCHFAKGDRLQFTAPSRDPGVANRDLAIIEKIHEGTLTARLDGTDKVVNFRVQDMRHSIMAMP